MAHARHFNAALQQMYSSPSAFRSESLAWMHVADSFMMRMRTRT